MRARRLRSLLALAAAAALPLAWAACSTDETQDPSDDAAGAGGASTCRDTCRERHDEATLELYDALESCLYCTECFGDCNGESRDCAAPDAQGTCDGKGICQDTDTDPDDDCATCALAGPCKDALDACRAAGACVSLVLCLEPC